MAGCDWDDLATVLAVLTPLVGVPLTVFTFYLKGLREQHRTQQGDLSARMGILSAVVERLRDDQTELRRDYATKEEWLREGIWARRHIERLSGAVARAQTELEQLSTAPAAAERALRAVAQLQQDFERAASAAASQE